MTAIQRFYSVKEAAALLTEHGLTVSKTWLYVAVEESRVPYTKLARICFSEAQLEQIIAQHTHSVSDYGDDLQPAAARRLHETRAAS
jgi:hypothetical protein